MNCFEVVYIALVGHAERCYAEAHVRLVSCRVCSPYWDADQDLQFDTDPTPPPRGDVRPGRGARRCKRGRHGAE